jgi:hypothetical protein
MTPEMKSQPEFVDEMLKERFYQRQRWTDPHDDKHNGLEWSGLLARYVGRIVDACLTDNRKLYRKALVVVAAVAMAAWEADFRANEPFLRDDPGATLPDASPQE